MRGKTAKALAKKAGIDYKTGEGMKRYKVLKKALHAIRHNINMEPAKGREEKIPEQKTPEQISAEHKSFREATAKEVEESVKKVLDNIKKRNRS